MWLGICHVGIYEGDGKFVHAEHYGSGVTVTSLTNDPRDANYWIAHYAQAIWPLPSQ
jgi:cell wall-associated NlpC family hydrolase